MNYIYLYQAMFLADRGYNINKIITLTCYNIPKFAYRYPTCWLIDDFDWRVQVIPELINCWYVAFSNPVNCVEEQKPSLTVSFCACGL